MNTFFCIFMLIILSGCGMEESDTDVVCCLRVFAHTLTFEVNEDIF